MTYANDPIYAFVNNILAYHDDDIKELIFNTNEWTNNEMCFVKHIIIVHLCIKSIKMNVIINDMCVFFLKF